MKQALGAVTGDEEGVVGVREQDHKMVPLPNLMILSRNNQPLGRIAKPHLLTQKARDNIRIVDVIAVVADVCAVEDAKLQLCNPFTLDGVVDVRDVLVAVPQILTLLHQVGDGVAVVVQRPGEHFTNRSDSGQLRCEHPDLGQVVGQRQPLLQRQAFDVIDDPFVWHLPSFLTTSDQHGQMESGVVPVFCLNKEFFNQTENKNIR